MNIIEHPILFSGEEFILTNSRVIYWKRKNSLILADLHLGKAAHFRKNGIALPVQTTLTDLIRLEYLMLHYQPEQVIIVGDFVHAANNNEVSLFRHFTSQFSTTSFVLIRGNHDRLSVKQLKNIGINKVDDSLEIDGIVFSHQPLENSGKCSVVGHIHPGVRIKMPTKGTLKFPCFWVSSKEIILPAFSKFTGLETNYKPNHTSCYAVTDEGIFKIF